jgi:tetratricopeptide (TPR) repeat protein
MRSSSRHSRKPYQALSLAVAASLLLGSAAQAADEPHNFVFTAYSNINGGSGLLSGNYEAAITELNQPPKTLTRDPAATTNNFCVAYAVTKQWDAARIACDKAVREAQQERADMPAYMIGARRRQNEYVAMALSNRAVLKWLSSDTAAAANDLQKAEALSPNSDFVVRNLTALHSPRDTVAQVIVAPKS